MYDHYLAKLKSRKVNVYSRIRFSKRKEKNSVYFLKET